MDTLEFMQTIYAEADRGYTQLFSLPSATAAPIDVNNIAVIKLLCGMEAHGGFW